MSALPRLEITEVYKADGIHAHGVGVTITPNGDGYVVRTCIPGGSKHGARYYQHRTYDWALIQANHWLTKTLPNRLKGGAQ